MLELQVVDAHANNDSVIEQPFKIPFVAAVAFYGNDIQPEITIEVVQRVAARTQKALDEGKWTEFKLLLRFLACLQSLYQDTGIFAFLSQLFDVVVDLQSANEKDVRHTFPSVERYTKAFLGCRH